MSWFSDLFWGGTATYGKAFPPIVDTIQDWGWSILPQFPGSQRDSSGSATLPQPTRPQPVSVPSVPVAYEDYGGGIESETPWIREVLPGPSRSGIPRVPREIVVVEGVSTEVERHEIGDFPAGSIFAPGAVWGGASAHDFDDVIEDAEMPFHAGLLDWGIDTLLGRQDWQTFGTVQPAWMGGPQSYVSPTEIPSGAPAAPPSAAPLANGARMTGDNCGNRRYVTLDRETGKISCKRRRRRRLLTNRDLADLASLKTITGGGAALNAAVIRAVR